MAGRLSAYFASRGPRGALSQFRDEFGDYLSVAEQAHMPLLKAMVLEDASLVDLGARQRKHLRMERFATTDAQEGGEVQRLVERGVARPAVVDVESEPEEPARRRKEGEAQAAQLPSKEPDVLEEHELAVEDEELDTPAAIALLRDFVSPTATDAPAQSRLALVWDAFSADADLRDSADDLELAVSTLHRLADPPAGTSPDLPLALRVLESLLEVLPDDIVAPQLSDVDDMPQDARLQVVLLRTAANVAVSEDYLSLATRALQSLERLRTAYPSLATSPESVLDVELLETALEQNNVHLVDERHVTYRPSTVATSSDTARPSVIALSAALLHLAARWRPSDTSDIGTPVLPSSLAPILASFAEEAAHRHRWDLLTQQWAIWSARGWTLPHWHAKLARWLAGDAPYSTYPLAPGETRSARPVRTDEFARFALSTCAALRAGVVGREWALDARSEWLELLCSSRASSPSTRRAARTLALTWHAAAPPSSAAPFVLRASALLALVRTSLPPFASGGPRTRAQAAQLVALHLSALVSRGSPYARADGQIAHFDLTTLAQAYGLLGDAASVAQVFRRLLDQRTLPDRKDVELVLAGAAQRTDRAQALQLVETAGRLGIRVDYATLEGVLRGLLEAAARAQRQHSDAHAAAADPTYERDVALAGVLHLARTLGARSADLARLRRFADDFLALRPAEARAPPRKDSPAAAAEQIRRARAAGDAEGARRAFARLTSAEGLVARDGKAVVLALEACEAAWRAARDGGARARVRQAMQEVVERALAPLTDAGEPSMVRSARALDLVLGVLPRVGDVEAVDALMEVMREQADVLGEEEALQPTEKGAEKIVRWAVAQQGREGVLAGSGWLAGAARRLLTGKEKEKET
ncbi:hypothetical protein JCM10450v2_008025 [Rhodotorula kratochvilovae]